MVSFPTLSARVSFLAVLVFVLKVSVCCSRKVVQDKDELSCYMKVKGVVAYESMLLNGEW